MEVALGYSTARPSWQWRVEGEAALLVLRWAPVWALLVLLPVMKLCLLAATQTMQLTGSAILMQQQLLAKEAIAPTEVVALVGTPRVLAIPILVFS